MGAMTSVQQRANASGLEGCLQLVIHSTFILATTKCLQRLAYKREGSLLPQIHTRDPFCFNDSAVLCRPTLRALPQHSSLQQAVQMHKSS